MDKPLAGAGFSVLRSCFLLRGDREALKGRIATVYEPKGKGAAKGHLTDME